MKDLLDRLNSLMNLLLLLSIAAMFIPAKPDSPLPLAEKIKTDADSVVKALESLPPAAQETPARISEFKRLRSIATQLSSIPDPREITYAMVIEAKEASYAPEELGDPLLIQLNIARANLNRRALGLAYSFYDAKELDSKDMVGGADRALQKETTLPIVGVPVDLDTAKGLFSFAVIGIWAYVASILVTVRKLVGKKPVSPEEFRQLASWVGFQPWPLGPSVAIGWIIGFPIAAALVALSDDADFRDVIPLLFLSLGIVFALFSTRRKLLSRRKWEPLNPAHIPETEGVRAAVRSNVKTTEQ